MKSLFKTSVFIMLYLLLTACSEVAQATPAPVSSPSSTAAPTITRTPSPTATVTLEPTPSPAYVEPTLVPTIDPTLVPGLLSKALSVQRMEGVSGHNIQQITGWEHGFGAGMRQYSCTGFDWLDKDHLVLYPAGGEIYESGYEGILHTRDVAPQPVIINLRTGSMWLPPVEESLSNCNLVYLSQELGILINLETPNGTPAVSTYTFDGRKLSSYTGQISDLSPSGTKILFEDNTLIDLRTNKRITLDWSLEDYYEPHLSGLYWTYPDETRVYRCCYFYADLTTGISQRFKRSDFQDANGTHLDASGLWFHQGEWVRDNKYFLVHWLAVDDGPVRYQPLFDPATKLFYDLWELVGIPRDLTWTSNETSPDRNYVLITGFESSHLVNLITFESRHFPYNDPYTYTEADWSADSKFVWFETHVYSGNESADFQILSIANGKLSPLPVTPLPAPYHWWHPIKASVVYPAADQDALIFLDASTMSYQELPFALPKPPDTYGTVLWSPNGEKLAMIAEDNSVWQVDYPRFVNLEQLTPSLPDVHSVAWSPDGKSIAFISGSDIYVVDTMK